MKYVDLQKNLEKLKVFSREDLKIFDDKFENKKLQIWIKKGYIKNIRRGFYAYGDATINENLQYFASNKIYAPSYISLETALDYYAIIPEQTFVVTAVGTNKTLDFDTQIGFFSYKKIKKNLFWGYKIIKLQDFMILMGDLEKVILDYFYLNPQIKNSEDLAGLRWNKEQLREKLDTKKLEKYLKMYDSKKLTQKIQVLFKYIQG